MVKRIKSFFRDMKLNNKIMLLYGILFLLPLMAVSSSIFEVVSKRLIRNMEYSARQGYEQSLSFLEYKLYRIIKLSDTVVTNLTVGEILTRREEDYSIHDQLLDFQNLRSYLQTLEDEGDVFRVKVYVPDSYVYSDDGSIIFGLGEADTAKWYTGKQNRITYFSPSQHLEADEAGFIALVRDFKDMNQYDRRIGVLRIDIAKDSLIDILNKANPTSNSVTYLINSERLIVAASNDGLMENYGLVDKIPEEMGYIGVEQANALHRGIIREEKAYYMRQKVKQTDWTMVTVTPFSDFYDDVDRMRSLIACMVLVLVVAVFCIGYLLISTVVRRIYRLVDGMQKIKKGNYTIHIDNSSKDEIGILIDNFNDMIRRTNELLNEKYEMGKELKSAELKALHSQINPHFLYNTLEMINWLGYGNKPEEIHSVVVSLSKYYRLTLNSGRELLRIEEELKHVGYYLMIEEKRFSGKFSYDINVPAELYDYVIPKITLQPLIENALLHGILERRDRTGTILIRGREEKDHILLLVIDDGIGMETSEIDYILNENIGTNKSGYGIRNVDRRIRLMFGEEYGLSFESSPGKGTTAIVRLPKSRKASV